MKKLSILFVSFFLVASLAKADIGSYDIVKISYQNRTYFVPVFHIGELIENGLCYRDGNGDEINMHEHLMTQYSRQKKIQIYESVQFLKTKKINPDHWMEDGVLVLFGKKISMGKFEFKNIEVESARLGNTYGFIHSKEMSEQDISWINDYPIEKICSIDSVGMCDITLFGIQGNFTEEEKKELKAKLSAKIKDGAIESIDKELSELYKQFVFMVGFCSC